MTCGKHYPESLKSTCTNKFCADTFLAYSKLIDTHKMEPNGFTKTPLFYNQNFVFGKQSFSLEIMVQSRHSMYWGHSKGC